VNELDNMNQKRFFPIGIWEHLLDKLGDFWYKDYMWHNTTGGSLKCCSDTFTMMHYVSGNEMHALEYYTYFVHPFGFDKNSTEVLPRKLSLDEIIAKSDLPGTGSHYFEINDRAAITEHEIEESERY
jgi:hypothetical protein